MRRLKADLHTHTADDPFDTLTYSAEMLIDSAAGRGVEVLAITCHELVAHTDTLAEYAARQNILLIPGIEKFIERKHVVILNPDPIHLETHTFEDLRAAGRRGALFLAPHPYYPSPSSLRSDLVRHIDLFDAIEWSSLYFRSINPNRWAERVARSHGLPLVGTSDTHGLPYLDTTFTWVESEKTIPEVLEAVRAGRIQLETRARPFAKAVVSAVDAVRGMVKDSVRGVAAGNATRG